MTRTQITSGCFFVEVIMEHSDKPEKTHYWYSFWRNPKTERNCSSGITFGTGRKKEVKDNASEGKATDLHR